MRSASLGQVSGSLGQIRVPRSDQGPRVWVPGSGLCPRVMSASLDQVSGSWVRLGSPGQVSGSPGQFRVRGPRVRSGCPGQVRSGSPGQVSGSPVRAGCPGQVRVPRSVVRVPGSVQGPGSGVWVSRSGLGARVRSGSPGQVRVPRSGLHPRVRCQGPWVRCQGPWTRLGSPGQVRVPRSGVCIPRSGVRVPGPGLGPQVRLRPWVRPGSPSADSVSGMPSVHGGCRGRRVTAVCREI